MNPPESTTRPITVLLVDDHAVTREGLCSCLRSYPHITVAGEAVDGQDAIQKFGELRPDIVVMDINMPKMSGLEATRRLVSQNPGVKILALTAHDSREYVLQLARSGARGYLLKDSSAQEFVQAVEAVHRGSSFFTPKVAQYVLDDYVSEATLVKKFLLDTLTPREREILILIAERLTNKQIAERLGVAIRTVETHRERLMRKLNLHSSSELVEYAKSVGLG